MKYINYPNKKMASENFEESENESENEIEEHSENESEEHSENESEDIQFESVYFKYWFEGCKTIDEVLGGIEALKDQFEQWKKEGHELTHPVDTGYCFIDKIYKELN